MTFIRTSRRIRLSRPLLSWSNAISPMSSAVGAFDDRATPTAVDTTPSIPFTPLLLNTRTPSRAGANHSRSRTGIDDDTTKFEPAAIASLTVTAHNGSVSCSCDANFASRAVRAFRSQRFQLAIHSVSDFVSAPRVISMNSSLMDPTM